MSENMHILIVEELLKVLTLIHHQELARVFGKPVNRKR